jgi:uncharacterized DUF497 family protein
VKKDECKAGGELEKRFMALGMLTSSTQFSPHLKEKILLAERGINFAHIAQVAIVQRNCFHASEHERRERARE